MEQFFDEKDLIAQSEQLAIDATNAAADAAAA